MRCGCGLLSLLFILGLYALFCVHVYAFVVVICPLIKSRFGIKLGLLWIIVGLTIIYGIVFNHFWAMILKPGSSKDQKVIE